MMRKITKTITITKVLIAILSIGIASLVLYNVKDMIFGTPLVVDAASDGATLSSNFLPISGSAKHAQELLINGRVVGIDKHGNFNDGIILSPGYNVVEVALKNRFGKETTKTYHWVVEDSEIPSLPTNPIALGTAPAETSATYQ